MLDLQRLQQAFAHGTQRGVEIGFRTQLAREFDQSAAVIVPVLVKVAIEAFLNPVADGLEEKCGDQHYRDQTGVA